MSDDDGRWRDEDPDVPEKHWAMDLKPGTTIEGLADSLVRELEAVLQMTTSSVWIRRGDTGEWREISDETVRRAAGE